MRDCTLVGGGGLLYPTRHVWASQARKGETPVSETPSSPTGTEVDLTVIVPVFNAVEHLGTLRADLEAISGLRVQVILVNDASGDDSAARIDAWAAEAPGVLALHHSDNQGAGVARNTAFPHATGRYTLFFDADDRLHGEVLADAVTAADKADADLVVFPYNYERDVGAGRGGMLAKDQDIWRDITRGKSSVLTTLAGAPGLLSFTNYPWNKLMRTARYRDVGLRFGTTRVNNDVLGHWYGLLFARQILLLNTVNCTHVVFSAGTNLTNARDATRMQAFTAINDTYDLLCAHPDLRQRYAHHFWNFALNLADWTRGRLAPEFHEQHRAALQALVARIDLSDYGRTLRRRSTPLAMRLMNVLLS